MDKFEYDIYKAYKEIEDEKYKRFNKQTSAGANALELLLIAFIVLKLCKVINWSWWWVLSPFWIPLGLAIILLLISVIIKLIIKHKCK